jgi:outer membrane receptor protein involved in Fe transport
VTQKFDLQFGGRYSENKQSSEETAAGADIKNHSREHVFTYSLSPKYKVDANTTLYARVAKGFRPGGPNVVAPDAPTDLQTYHSDTVTSFEAGVKSQSTDHRYSIDAAAFHINWKNIQLFTQIGLYGVNINGSSAESDGVELNATARPVRGLELSLNGALTIAHLTGDTPPDVGGREGDQLPFTPTLSVALNGDYHWQLSSNARAHVGASLRHLSSQTAEYDPDFVTAYGHQRRVHPYSVVDLFAGVDFGRFDLEVYVKNLGNSHGVTSTIGPFTQGLELYPNGAVGTGIIRPRSVGLTVGYSY